MIISTGHSNMRLLLPTLQCRLVATCICTQYIWKTYEHVQFIGNIWLPQQWWANIHVCCVACILSCASCAGRSQVFHSSNCNWTDTSASNVQKTPKKLYDQYRLWSYQKAVLLFDNLNFRCGDWIFWQLLWWIWRKSKPSMSCCSWSSWL